MRGPKYAAMVRLLEEPAAAPCVTEPTAEAIGAALLKLRDTGQRRALAESTRKAVGQQLSTEAMRKVWAQGVAELASVG